MTVNHFACRIGLLALAMALPMEVHATGTPPDAKTEAAVAAADEAWGAAEEKGDAAYVDWLLLPDYRSIGHEGKVTGKDAIVAHTRAHAGSDTRKAEAAAWRAAHPSRSEVRLFGDTAVLNWVSTTAGSGEPVASCDIFVYRDGHWHAIYSQHTEG